MGHYTVLQVLFPWEFFVGMFSSICVNMAGNVDIHMPETVVVFTFGRSRFADNIPSYFYIRNDPVLEVACGDEHTAVICQNGRVFVFGNNDYGQLGLGHRNVTVKPSCVKSLKPEKATHVACGRAHTLLSTSSGKIFSWGSNSDGQLGVGDTADRLAPTRVMGIQDDIVQLSAGCVSSAALTARGQVYVWGSNSDGQLGLPGTSDTILRPVLLPFAHQIVHISCGYYHTAFVTENGALYTCGESESGKLGLPDSLTNITSPQKVALGLSVKYAFCGGNHTIALTADGEVFAFGNNFNGQLGLGPDVSQSILPTRIISLKSSVISDVACGESHTAFITDRGVLYTCGEGRHGKLCSDQDNNSHAIPIKVTRFKGFTVQKVACGGCHTMVLANKSQEDEDEDEDELNLLSESLDGENEENSLPVFTNQNALPPLQRVRIESPNNNTAFTGCFQENQNNNLEEVQDEPTDMMVIEKDLEVKSTLSGSKESSSDEGEVDAGVHEEMSPKSVKPEKGKRETISYAMDVTETTDIEDDIKDVDVESEKDSDCDQEGENTDVKMESEEKKEGRVARFFSAFRRKKPSSAPSVGLDSCGSRQRAASEGGVRKEEHAGGDAEQDRRDSGRSNIANLGNEIRSKACALL